MEIDGIILKTENFEGPLDLLLHLLSKKKMEIKDIDIVTIVDQYLQIIESTQQMNLEIASEFIYMASKLIYLKSLILLPQKEEVEQLKSELVGQLIEYQICKQIAEKLGEQSHGFGKKIRPSAEFFADKTYEKIHHPLELLLAYVENIQNNQKKMPPAKKHFDAYVATPMISVNVRAIYILKSLRVQGKIPMIDLFVIGEIPQNVATFLAVLELIKKKRIEIYSENYYITLK